MIDDVAEQECLSHEGQSLSPARVPAVSMVGWRGFEDYGPARQQAFGNLGDQFAIVL